MVAITTSSFKTKAVLVCIALKLDNNPDGCLFVFRTGLCFIVDRSKCIPKPPPPQGPTIGVDMEGGGGGGGGGHDTIIFSEKKPEGLL